MRIHWIRDNARIIAIPAALMLLAGACSNSTTSSDPAIAATTIDTNDAIKSAAWNPTIKITYSEDSINFQPDGIPNHERDAYYAVPNAGVVVPDASSSYVMKDPTKAQTYSFDIPSSPAYSSEVTKASLGSIGL